MNVVPFVDEGLGNTSWFVDLGDGRAMVVDAGRDPRPYLAEAERRKLELALAAETHLHADFITGNRELGALGVDILAPAKSDLTWPHRSLHPGDELDLGGLVLRALATPGHTPEHLAYLLLDGSRPVAVFTGGSLLVGAVARTDLIDREATDGLSRALWSSIHDQLLALPDEVVVYPTHGAGSFCSAPAGDRRWTTIGAERAANPLLTAPDEDTFVRRLLDGLGTYPPYFLRSRERNRLGPRVYGVRQPDLPALSVDDLRQATIAGAEVIDVRPVEDFAAGHLPGSLSIPLRPQFGSWLGWLVEDDRPLAFVLGPDQDPGEVVRQSLAIGYEHLLGALAGGIEAWAATQPLERTALVDARVLADRPVLDVRQASEFEAGHLPAAVHLELGSLGDHIDSVPPGPLAVMCGHGERAMTAASLLARAGRNDIAVVVGGPSDWAGGSGCPLATTS